jgi:protein SCO1
MARLWASGALVLCGAVVAGTAWFALGNRSGDPFAQCRTSQVAGGEAAIGGPFTLIDQTGARRTEADVLQGPSLVYFGYSFCPDVCPVDLSRNVEAVDILEEKGLEVTPVFISVDPKRDTPEVLADFAANLHPRLVALTGTPEEIQAAAQAYKAYYKIHDTGDAFYLVDHSVFTYLMLPGGEFVDLFRRDVTPDQMAETVACFLG